MPRFNRMTTFAGAFVAFIFLSYFYTTGDSIRNTFNKSAIARKPRPCLGAIEAGRDRLYEVYSKSLAGVTHVAVCDWPYHHNSGDSAIWLGEMALLESLGKKVAYICGIDDCVTADMNKALEDVPNAQTAVLLHGGGIYGHHINSYEIDLSRIYPIEKSDISPRLLNLTSKNLRPFSKLPWRFTQNIPISKSSPGIPSRMQP
jgi:hypothetical protein